MRQVTSSVRLAVRAPADLVFSVAVAGSHAVDSEQLTVTVEGDEVDVAEVPAPHGTRLHRVRAPVGTLDLEYAASVGDADPVEADPLDDVEFLRPSRYCDSDRLAKVARTHFGTATGTDLVREVRGWMLGQITYAPGSSGPVDGALDTYLARKGVCRDTTHLMVAFLRALGTPARLVSAYAPGLVPMDFHAVAEVLLDGQWHVVDGTGLSSRPALVRIATGRDAADTAFLTVQSGMADLLSVQVTATTGGRLPADDGDSPVRIR